MTTDTLGRPPAAAVRTGPAWWWRSFHLMVRRDLAALRVELVTMLIFQTLTGAGAALIYGFVLGDVGPTRLTYIVTGAPVLALIPVGMTYLPGVIANTKAEGSYDYTWSLPVPRTAAAAATVGVFTVAALPGAAVSLIVATWRYDVDLAVSAGLVVAVALTALMAASVGYAIGHGIPDPQVTNLVTNLVIFTVLMFSPIAFPIEQFPGWLAGLHHALPFHHMATVIRGGLTDGLVTDLARSYVILALWVTGSWAFALRIIGRAR